MTRPARPGPVAAWLSGSWPRGSRPSRSAASNGDTPHDRADQHTPRRTAPMQPIDWNAIEAREQMRATEDQIRQTYRQLTGGQDTLVTLTELRAALPAELSREQVDVALRNLRDHADVH